MKKQDVYVVVDTPKKAKKLKKVLDMFNEPIYRETNQRLSENGVSKEYPIINFVGVEWAGYCDKSHQNKTEASIKQLRTILAKEHLKVGDYVVSKGDFGQSYLFKISHINEDGLHFSIFCDLSIKKKNEWCGRVYIDDFKRYATPEEIVFLGGSDGYTTITSYDTTASELREEKKDLEAGKWYKGNYYDTKYLVFPTELHNETVIKGYGFDDGGSWRVFNNDADIGNNTRLAFSNEVESALIEEAKRRGFDYDDFVFEDLTNILWANYDSDIDGKEEKAIFNNGKWAEVIKADKFAELKEAHKNGAVIQFKSHFKPFEWIDVLHNKPSWNTSYEYRIKPEEKPKVGDVVKAWDNGSSAYTVGKVIEIGNIGYFLQDDLWWDNAEVITRQQLLDLFPNIE